MTDVTTGIKALSISPSSIAYAEANGADLNGMLSEATVQAGELLRLIGSITAVLPPGDSNIATLNGLVTTMATFCQYLFNINTNSGLIATINMG